MAEEPVSPDGTKVAQRITWYDTELEVDCEFSMGIDGTYRCYPTEEIIKVANPSPTCDPAEHLAQLPTGTSAACSERYASRREWIGDCLGEQRVLGLRLGGFVSTAENTAYGYTPLYSTDECLEVTLVTDAVYAFCDVEVVPQDTFVTAREEVREVGQVLQHVLFGDDGSMQIFALRHPELGVNLYTAEGELIPEVTNVAGDFAFADVACTVAVVPGSSCAPAVRVESSCGEGQTHRIGPRVDRFFTRDAGGACIRHPNSAQFLEAEVNGGPSYHTLEDALPRIDSQERVAGGVRLGNAWVEHDGEAIFSTGYFFDRELGTPCWPDATEGSRTRCVPLTWGEWVPLFEDASCANVAAYRLADSCGEAPAALYSGASGVLARMVPVDVTQPLFQWAYQAPTPPENPAESPCIPWTEETEMWQAEPMDPTEIAVLNEVLE